MESDCPLVLIRWEDSRQPLSGWQHLSDLKLPNVCECATVGWLLKDEPDRKVVAQSMGGITSEHDIQAMGIVVIPTRCVLSIEHLEETSELSSASCCSSSELEQRRERSSASA